MELEQIRELIGLMKDNDMTEIRLNEGETRLLLKRGSEQVNTPVLVSQSPASPAPVASAPYAAAQQEAMEEQEDDGLVTINSPMVGTFYAAPSPDDPPFAKANDRVNPETVVCIVEAMKVMNEIKAEVSGTIVTVLAENAKAVEFGQPLFKVKPD